MISVEQTVVSMDYLLVESMVFAMVESLAALRAERKVDQMVEMKDV